MENYNLADQKQDWRLNKDAGMWVDRNTGEAVQATCVYVEPGGQCLSAAEVERRRKYGEMMRKRLEDAQNEQIKKEIRTEQEKILGPYVYTIASENAFDDLSPDTLARVAYLASYLKFNTDELWRTQRTRMKQSDLPNIMNFAKPTAARFWREVKNKYFYSDADGFLHTIGDSFVMGNLVANPGIEYQKLYQSAMRELYANIPLKQHKRLGFAIKMLPFLNFEYNILCYNPDEKEKDKILPLTVSEFCDAVGFDKTHADKLAREYGRLRFTVDGRQEVFCKFLSDGDSISDAHICLNPRLVYKGSNFERVAAIGISFAASSRPA